MTVFIAPNLTAPVAIAGRFDAPVVVEIDTARYASTAVSGGNVGRDKLPIASVFEQAGGPT